MWKKEEETLLGPITLPASFIRAGTTTSHVWKPISHEHALMCAAKVCPKTRYG